MPVGCVYLNPPVTNASFMFGLFEPGEPDLETFGEAILELREDGESPIVVSHTHKPGAAADKNDDFVFWMHDGWASMGVANDDLLDLWPAALA